MKRIIPAAVAAMIAAGASYALAQAPAPYADNGESYGQGWGPGWGPGDDRGWGRGDERGWGPPPEMRQRWEQRRAEMEIGRASCRERVS
jgi:hypothetical protein